MLKIVSHGLIFGALTFIPGCDSFLDEVPDNRVALDDLEKAAQLLTNAYSIASPAFTDFMSDDVAYTRGTTIRPEHDELFEWQDVTVGPTVQDTPDFYWYTTYDAIAHANEVLAVLDDLMAETEEEIARKAAIEGEALLTRAYGHFMLVNLFAKHYNESSSSTDPGIPYITSPETSFIVQYTRGNLSSVYDKIETDLQSGLQLVNDNFYSNSGKYHFTKNAALAFASRFYLYKSDYDKCVEYSNELLDPNPSLFIRDFTSQEYQNAKSSIQGYPQLYSSPDEQANLLLMRKISFIEIPSMGHRMERNFYGSLFGTNPFGATDERENPAFVSGQNALFPVRYEILFERSSINSNVGIPYHIGIMFKGEEVLLNRVEANIHRGRYQAAINDLQLLSEKRFTGGDVNLSMDLLRQFYGVQSNPFVSDFIVLLDYTINFERRKEFLGQGMRWFDIKRHEYEVDHTLSDGSTITLDENDLRKVLQIPESAIDVGGLKANPR